MREDFVNKWRRERKKEEDLVICSFCTSWVKSRLRGQPLFLVVLTLSWEVFLSSVKQFDYGSWLKNKRVEVFKFISYITILVL